MSTSREITELVDDMNSKISYWQMVREDANRHIQEFIDAKHELIDTNRNDVIEQ